MKHLATKGTASALLLLSALAACAPAVNEDGIARRTVREIDRTFRDTAEAELALSPETATRLGLDNTLLAQPFQNLLNDRSQARFERTRLLRLELLSRLNATPFIPGESTLARHLEIIRGQYEALTRLEAYGFGRYELGLARPYAADQLSGAWVDVPELLISSQPLGSYKDADAYLARLNALPGALDDEKRRLMSDAANGILPPDFVLDRLASRLRAFAEQPVETHPLLQRFEAVVGGLGSDETHDPETYVAAARRLMTDRIVPAYIDFAEEVETLGERASPQPGLHISARTGGDDAALARDYYRDVLSFYTEADADPDFLHREGLAAVAEIQAEINAAFDELGLIGGTGADRLALLATTPGQVYLPTDEDRQRLLQRLTGLVAQAQSVMPDLLNAPPPAGLIVTRMPAYKEAALTGAMYVPAAANGSSPALFQINLERIEEWPDFSLATLVHHEGVPGHHIESASAAASARLPLLRQMIWNTAYGEGWAVYAEDLADDAGLFSSDPLGRIGYLQSILFRAARLVVDTGIHSQGWSFEEAVTYLTDTTGYPREAMEEEVARYAVWPGQAAAYFYGRSRLIDMRDRAKAVLGTRFDERGFNSAILEGGPRPLSMVEQDIETWYGGRLER